jgi:hypothetical protein
MKLTELEITRGSSYSSTPNMLIGRVKIEGATGSQEIALSAGAISRLIGCIATEVAQTARGNAQQTASVLENATQEALLIESDGLLLVDSQS